MNEEEAKPIAVDGEGVCVSTTCVEFVEITDDALVCENVTWIE